MRTDELQRLRTIVLESPLLTQVEKTEWIQLIPEMNDMQLTELSRILSAASQIRKPVQPVQMPTKPQPAQNWKIPDWKERELEPGVNPIPKQTQPLSPAQPFRAAMPAQPATQPAQRYVPVSSVISDPIQPRDQQESPIANKISAAKLAETSALKFTLNTPDDLTKINIDYLRQGSPQMVLANLLQKIYEFNKKYTFTGVLGKIEQSPLYKSYYDLGFALLNDSNPDRGKVYDSYLKNAAGHGQKCLTMEEFEAFADFRKSLERILV